MDEIGTLGREMARIIAAEPTPEHAADRILDMLQGANVVILSPEPYRGGVAIGGMATGGMPEREWAAVILPDAVPFDLGLEAIQKSFPQHRIRCVDLTFLRATYGKSVKE